MDPLCNLVFEFCYGVQIMYIFFNLDEEIWLIFSLQCYYILWYEILGILSLLSYLL